MIRTSQAVAVLGLGAARLPMASRLATEIMRLSPGAPMPHWDHVEQR